MPQQSRRRNLDVVDQELLGNKQNKKIFKNIAYAMGVGIGFILLIPMLPDIGDEAKQEGMEAIYFIISYTLMVYSISLGLGFFFLRPYVALVAFILNWVVMPMVGIWALVEGYKVISG